MSRLLNDKPYLAVAGTMLLAALATIAAAWGFQLIGGYIPCKLCLQQRLPYYAGIPVLVGVVVAAAYQAPQTVLRGLLAVATLTFVAGAVLGIYHTGVEYGWWLGPSDCGAGGGGAASTAEDLLKQLENVRIVSCNEASWRFPDGWGLSFAGWNAALSLGLVALGAIGLTRRSAA